MRKEIIKKLKKIKLLALDFDGVLTLGAYVITNENGEESVLCSRRDSLGLDLLKKTGLDIIVISKESNKVVEKRCQKLGLRCWRGLETANDKLEVLQSYAASQGLKREQICYGGDDVNDLACLKWVGFGFTVQDGHFLCKKIARYITKACGGQGAVREVCEMLLQAKNNAIEF